MGLIYSGVPRELVIHLASSLEMDLFIETGTYYGETAKWASKSFEKVITIEASLNIYEDTCNDLANFPNITHLFGNSSTVLSQLKINQPAIFWLDAHYSGGDTFKGDNPLIKEIEVINSLDTEKVLLIDDARFITSVWMDEQYCELSDLIMTLANRNQYIAIFDDILISVPRHVKSIVDNYTNGRSRVLWEEYLKKQMKQRKPISRVIIDAIKHIFYHQSQE